MSAAADAISQAAAEDIIRRFDLRPHPEGGHYRETFRDRAGPDGRAYSTAILFLLCDGEVSHWHRVDAAEIWHFHAGSALTVSISEDGETARTERLWHSDAAHFGPATAKPQVVVPPGAWQSARSEGAWSLVGCTVAPGFDFERFELAPPGWTPGAPLPTL